MVPFRGLIHEIIRHSFFLISKTYISRGPLRLVCLSFERGIRSTFHPEAVAQVSRSCSKDSKRRVALSKVVSHKLSGSFHWLWASMACATAVFAITRIIFSLRRPYMEATLSLIQISVNQISGSEIIPCRLRFRVEAKSHDDKRFRSIRFVAGSPILPDVRRE
jgi:hypothetical protein